MGKTFGSPIPAVAADEKLNIFIAGSAPKTAWQHVGVTADFLGAMFAPMAARDGADELSARHGIGYLVNELLENAIKFRAEDELPVGVSARLDGGMFVLELRNDVTGEVAESFSVLLDELMSRDPGDLLIEKIEKNAEGDSDGGSGLGILTLMGDYGVEMGWEFRQTDRDGIVELTTYSRLPLD